MMPIIKPVKDGRFFIKWLHAKYLEAIADLECTSCERMWSRTNLMNLMLREDAGGYIISDLQKPVGYIVYEINSDEGLLRLLNLVIHPDYRNQGLGTLLLERVCSLVAGNPFEGIEAFVKDTNLVAHLFLKKNGFVSTKVHRSYFVDVYEENEYSDAYHFQKLEEKHVQVFNDNSGIDVADRQLDGTAS